MSKTYVEGLESRTLMSTYYVASGGTNGAGHGSDSTPWQTLQYAADHVVAGDTVIVRAGHYTGFDIRHSGTAAKRITFKADRGVVIDHVNTVTNKDGINIENASYIIVDGFTLRGTNDPATSRAGIRVVGDGFDYDDGKFSKAVILRNNKADQWGQWGILTGFCDDMVIQNNTCSRSAQQHGIYFSNSGDRVIIRNNTVWGNAACGIHMNADIETGDTSNPKVDGIITGALVEGNTIYGNGGGSAFSAGGGSGINCDGVRDSQIQNNVLFDNHSTGIALYQIDAAAPAINDVIANNTVINASNSRFCLLVTDGATGTTVFNNIFCNLSSNSVRGAIELSADSTSGFRSDYNIMDARNSFSDTVGSFAQWAALTHGDAHSRTLTTGQMKSLFRNFDANDYTLAPSSLARGCGINSLANGTLHAAPSIDRLHSARPINAACAIGAYET